MQYIALLRAINVGGNSLIKMSELKECFEKMGFTNVTTFIQSGNVIFESVDTSIINMRSSIEKILSKRFGYSSIVVLFSQTQYKKIIQNVPPEWYTKKDIRCYIAFVREPVNEKEVLRSITLKEGVDFASTGPHAIYMTTLTNGLTKSGFTKFIGTKLYKYVTMRNYNTSKKILDLMTSTCEMMDKSIKNSAPSGTMLEPI